MTVHNDKGAAGRTKKINFFPFCVKMINQAYCMQLNRYSTDEALRDESGKPGEDLCMALCRTCSGQPGLLLNIEGNDDSPKNVHHFFYVLQKEVIIK